MPCSVSDARSQVATNLELTPSLKDRFPDMEYLVRFGWHPDGKRCEFVYVHVCPCVCLVCVCLCLCVCVCECLHVRVLIARKANPIVTCCVLTPL